MEGRRERSRRPSLPLAARLIAPVPRAGRKGRALPSSDPKATIRNRANTHRRASRLRCGK